MNTKTINISCINVADEVDPSEVFAVDTNVLYWMHSSFDVNAKKYQTDIYPQFISDLIDNGNKLVTTIYNCMELLHLIEKRQLDLHNINNSSTIRLKNFRNNAKERLDVKNECDVVFEQIKELYDIRKFVIEIEALDEFIQQFEKHKCDNFDYNTLKYYREENIKNIITDDQDFISFSGINVYTANRTIINKVKP